MKMVMHATSGGNIEIMGLMQGYICTETRDMIVTDAFALPVEGTETRVNAAAEGYEYMIQYLGTMKAMGRNDNVMGWYHSHPGYGCWLSGIDVATQMLHQKHEEPFLAVVVIKVFCYTKQRRRKSEMLNVKVTHCVTVRLIHYAPPRPAKSTSAPFELIRRITRQHRMPR